MGSTRFDSVLWKIWNSQISFGSNTNPNKNNNKADKSKDTKVGRQFSILLLFCLGHNVNVDLVRQDNIVKTIILLRATHTKNKSSVLSQCKCWAFQLFGIEGEMETISVFQNKT